jgi:outer membrane protein, heavy metal efflux system
MPNKPHLKPPLHSGTSVFAALLSTIALSVPAWGQMSAALPATVVPTAAPAVVSVATPTPTALPARAITLAQALQAARDNLDVSLARRVLGAAQADIVSADRAPQPVVSGKVGQMDFQHGLGSGNPLTQKRIDKAIGVDWTWERGGKRILRTRVAQRNAAAAQADVEDVRTQQVLATWNAYFDLLSAQDRLAQVRAIQLSAAQLSSTAARRVAAGDLSVQEASRTEIEAQRAQADVQVAQLDVQRASVALNQLVHLPAQRAEVGALQAMAEWPVAALSAIPSTTGAPSNSTAASALSDSALAAVIEQRADMRAARERVEASVALRDSANALKRADITVGSSIDHFPGTSTRMLELRMQMPLQWNYSFQGEIARAEAELTLAQDRLEQTRLLASIDMQRLWQELLGSTQRAQTYDADIVPRAQRVAAGAELAYSKGASPLTDLLDARRTLRTTLLEALAARTEHAKALGAWQVRTQPQSLAGRASGDAP